MSERCSECRFWNWPQDPLIQGQESRDEDADGMCQRFPPVYNPLCDQDEKESTEKWQQPMVWGGAWCGEFRAK